MLHCQFHRACMLSVNHVEKRLQYLVPVEETLNLIYVEYFPGFYDVLHLKIKLAPASFRLLRQVLKNEF